MLSRDTKYLSHSLLYEMNTSVSAAGDGINEREIQTANFSFIWCPCSAFFFLGCGRSSRCDKQRASGHTHHQALRALAHKWLKILLAMQRNGTPYNEAVFLNSRRAYLLQTPEIRTPAKAFFAAGLT